FERGAAAADPVESIVPMTPDEQAMLMYSSGTTGRPKGVVLTHGNILAAVINEAINFEADRNTVSYAVMPLFHIGAMMGFSVPAMFFGGTAIVERVFDPVRMLDTITREDYGVTHFLGLPAIYGALAMQPEYATADFSRVVIAAGGAEPMPEPLLKSWYEHGVPIVEVYGMTEVCGLACSLLREDIPDKIGSAGKAAMFIDMKIMKSATEEAAPGEQGEIWMRGANVTPGYWNRPEANEEAFVDGWLRSGDIGRKDAEGFIYIDDRIKDMYISGGENVYPAEVENVLYMLPQVAEAAVVGVPDPKWGEVGCAVVVLKEGESLDLPAVTEHCAQHLARYKHPQKLVIRDELPRNATGKVLKFKIRESLASG
ncbi:MAG: AMP-binding protein, partial [Xanthomonadales bacterium]|nr:AMP-binding protein [Xanthomonadales bacterium]